MCQNEVDGSTIVVCKESVSTLPLPLSGSHRVALQAAPISFEIEVQVFIQSIRAWEVSSIVPRRPSEAVRH